ncbi:uncharacterized protein LOC142336765 [Convolutriloba macropyga]|uniref:uncharacterized protein LOC142336765 n=1 Tax=Convolutriloba macropyga TaxID=536237 RepID=UPI003F5230C8
MPGYRNEITIEHEGKVFDLKQHEISREFLTEIFEVEPKFLVELTSNPQKVISFNNLTLEPGKKYAIKTRTENSQAKPSIQNSSNWLQENINDVQHSLILSNASYQNDPESYLTSAIHDHSFCSIVVSARESNRFIIAQCEESDTFYIAFRGTGSWADLATDLSIAPTPDMNTVTPGNLHAGFLKRAASFPLRKILTSDLFVDKNLVLCGHSLGGAISSIVYMQLLHKSQKVTIFKSLKNITFGAPLFCDAYYRDNSNRITTNPQIFNIIAENDPVPSLLLLTQLISTLKARAVDDPILRTYTALLESLNPLISGVLSLATLIDSKYKVMLQSIKEGLRSLDISGRQGFENTYVPLGNYFFMSEHELRTFNSLTDQTILLQKLNIFENFQIEAFEKHKLENYHRMCILHKCTRNASIYSAGRTASLSESQINVSRNISRIRALDPVIHGGELLQQTDSQGRQILKLELQGENLTNIILPIRIFNILLGDENTLGSSIDTIPGTEIFVLRQPVENFEADAPSYILNLTTDFGHCQFKLPTITIMRDNEDPGKASFSPLKAASRL